jgi:hypothetical protein
MDNPLPGRFGTGKGRINKTLICPPGLLELIPEAKPFDPSKSHIMEVRLQPGNQLIWSRADDPEEILLKDALNVQGDSSVQYGPKA